MFIASLWTSIVAWFTPTILFCVTNIMIAAIYIASNNDNNKHNDHAQSDSISRITTVSSFVSRTRSMNLSSYTPITTSVTSESHHNYEYQSNPPSYTSSSRLAQSIHRSPSYVTPLEISNDDAKSSIECEQLPLSELIRTPILERVKSFKLSSFYTEPEHTTNSSSRQLDRVPSFYDRVKSFKISSPFTYETPSTQTASCDKEQVREYYISDQEKGFVSEMNKSHSEMRIADDEDDVNLRRPATTKESRTFVDEEVDVKADQFISRFKLQLRLQRLESLARYNDMLKRRSSN